MNRSPSLIALPFIEFWLIPLIFVLIVAVLSLLDPHSLCSTSCPCIEQTP